jgi:hypothetical protein
LVFFEAGARSRLIHPAGSEDVQAAARPAKKIDRAKMKNMGTADRLIRISIAVAIAVAYFAGAISGTLAIVLGVIAVAFVLTSLVSTWRILRPAPSANSP